MQTRAIRFYFWCLMMILFIAYFHPGFSLAAASEPVRNRRPEEIEHLRTQSAYTLALHLEFEGGGEAEAVIIPGFEYGLVLKEPEELAFGIGFPLGLGDDNRGWGMILDIETEF